MVVLGTFMAQMADKMTPARPRSPHAAARMTADAEQLSAQAGLRSLSIPRDVRGHFPTEGRIDGQRIGFMVDTGASVVALNETLRRAVRFAPVAQRLQGDGHNRQRHHQGGATRIAMVDIGGLIVRDVDAMVLPDEALSENLLGLSFLSKLKRFEYANGKMVLEQ